MNAITSDMEDALAAIQGFCVGGGFELAMCADIIVAADTAEFGLPETKVGVIGECGVLHRAVRQLPHRVAMAMILTGKRLNAGDAERFGLVNEVVPAAELVHNRTSKIVEPVSRNMRIRPNDVETWTVQPVPNLQIVDRKQWNDVQVQLEARSRTQPQEQRRGKHLLSGLESRRVCGSGWIRIRSG